MFAMGFLVIGQNARCTLLAREYNTLLRQTREAEAAHALRTKDALALSNRARVYEEATGRLGMGVPAEVEVVLVDLVETMHE